MFKKLLAVKESLKYMYLFVVSVFPVHFVF